MNHAKDLLDGFVEYYRTSDKPRQYSRRMAMDIVDRYSWISANYKLALHDEVVRNFTPTQMRPLPDMASLATAEKALPPPNTMVDHTEVKALPEPEVKRENFDIDAMIKEGRREEYNRVKAKIDAGNGTQADKTWLENYDKPKRTVPGVKHVSQSVEREAEENW